MLLSLENKELNPLDSSTTTIPLHVMSSTESLRVNGLERNTSIWYLFKHNWRQLTSLIPGAAVGSLIGGFLNSRYSKILIYYSVSVAIVPVSVAFVLHRTLPYLLLIGRVSAGILYGVILITLVLHIADNSNQYMRRHFMWTITAINLLPTIKLAEIISTVTGECIASSIGVLMFALAILTLIFMPCTYESIVFLLKNGTDLRALEIMLKLRNESRHHIRRDFNEFKMMLAEDYSNDGENMFSNLRPLFLVLLLRLLSVLLTSNCIYWLFLANIWFDYQYWMCSTPTMSKPLSDVFENLTHFNASESFALDKSTSADVNGNTTLFANLINETLSNQIGFNNDSISWARNESIISVANNSTILNHLFMHSVNSYHLPSFRITKFILLVTVVKIVIGIPFLCLAEKFQVYRNRIILKVTICVAAINLVFFVGTLVCSYTDDSLLFTFYISKLLCVIYGFYLLVAFSIDTVGYSELSETFSLKLRYGCIAFIAICEHLCHTIAILLVMNALFRFYFHVLQSAIICFICYLLLKWMPNECLTCTLRAARDKHFVKMATANN
ncbi:uncharacterized protein LOC116350778 isoform X2 [Contarinia nasturtii]|uniref:uncharacterized protein LOC116350778 isoform X2 n=1 Tax=Contarinia nasturtii TaxID=265458 RepID=UPI0012D46324|nr:uncharacterized protein LOC116350778 isoform X2 [Contarinia nasturtii]